VLTVDPDGGTDAYDTIQTAVNNAESGDTIEITSGIYNEQVIVSGASNLTITGSGASTEIQSPVDPDPVATDSIDRITSTPLAILGSTNVTVSGMEIDGQNQGAGGKAFFGIFAENSSVTLSDLKVVNTTQNPDGSPSGNQFNDGIRLSNTDNIDRSSSVNDVTVERFDKRGIRAEAAGSGNLSVEITDSTVIGTPTGNPAQNGISLASVSATVVNNSVINTSYISDTDVTAGLISTIGVYDSRIEENTLQDDSSGGSTGIFLNAAQNVSVTNNEFDNASFGVFAFSGAGETEIRQNQFTDHSAAILLSSSSGEVIENNQFENNVRHFRDSDRETNIKALVDENEFDTAAYVEGGQQFLYSSIDDAVNGDLLSGGGAEEGDTIVVESGNYEESVKVGKQVTLTAADGASPEIDVSGSGGPSVAIESSDVTVEGFEIVGDGSTTSGISIRTSDGANSNISIRDNVIGGMAAPGGGGPGKFSFGILSFSSSNDDGATLSGVNVTGNTIENIGSQGETQGVAISLEELNGTSPGDGALVKNNNIINIATKSPERPGTGIALQPDDGSSSGAGDAAARVAGNEFSNTQIRVTHPVGDDTVEVPDQTQTAVEDGQVVFTDSGDVVVDADDGDGDFSSIQNAVDAAATGATIVVESGIYEESVKINTDGLTLAGAGPDSTTIIGDGENVGSQPHAAIHVDDSSGPVRNVTIEGLTVENPDGKYGIFAGTGSTNKDPDGIGGLVIRDNVIQDISTNSTGGALTGGPAGIGIRGDYGTDGNPGIEISNNEIDDVENLEGGPEPVGITLKSFTGDAGFGFDNNGDPADDPSSPPATDTDILNNEISNISSNGGYATKGISVSGEFEDIDIINNSLTNIESPGGTAIGITFSENNRGDEPEDYKYDIDDDGNGERIGPQDFDIRNNEISQVSAPDARSVNIGGYEELGDHTASRNNISDGVVARFFGDQAGFDPADADILDARLNWWGNERGPRASSSSGIAGAVGYDPFLVTPAENINADDVGDTQQFAQDVVVPADQEITAVGFPGPTDQTVGEAFSEFNGTIYEYNRENGSFESVTDGSREISSLDAFVVTQDNNETKRKDVQVVIEYANAAPEEEFPGSKTIEPGFNFIAPRGVGDAYGAFNSPSDRETIYGTYSQPEGDSAFLPVGSVVDPRFVESTFGPEQDDPVVNPYSGYLVFTEEERTITTYVQSGVTADEILNEQNLDRTAE